MIFGTDINFKKRWKSVLKVPIPFEVIPNESIFVHAADQFFISEAAEPATSWDGGGLSILRTTVSQNDHINYRTPGSSSHEQWARR